nr:putative nucleotidyltransferase, ribonuclease H [Tanacetum cinerariifolium]
MKMEILLESTSNKLMIGHKNNFVSDSLIDFQIKFSLSIGEIVTHWFTLIVLYALRRSGNENMLGLIILMLRSILTDLQVGERVIEGPELIEVTNEKVVVAKEKLKEARTRQKSHADKQRRSLEF